MAAALTGALLFNTLQLPASSTATWEMTSYQDFLKGKLDGLSLSRDGHLTLAPRLDEVFSSDQPVIWSLAQAPDGTLYAGTGNRGRLFEIDKSGKSKLLWTAEQPEIFALAVDKQGVIYAGTSPQGKVYRIEHGKATEYFAPKSRYIWSLALASDGALFVGTGDQGKVYRVTRPGKGEQFYDTGQAHVTGLSLDAQGRLLAGTEPNGILYRIFAKDKAFVLYDSTLPEIRAIATDPDGSIYAVGLGGSVNKRAQSASQAAQTASGTGTVPSVSTSITVTAESAQSGPEIKAPPDPSKPAATAAATTTTATPAPATSQVIDVSGTVERSAIYKIHTDNTVETLWSSKEENVYDLLAQKGQVLFATDVNSRIYRLSADRKLTLVVQTNDAEATRLIASGNSVLAATGSMGKIYRLGDQAVIKGAYESPVFDANTVAKWGNVRWGGEGVVLRTRTGNALRPDRTWSDWSTPLSRSAGSPVTSPNARYIEWKAELTGANASLDSVSVSYLPQNSAPVARSILVLTQVSTAAAAKPASTSTNGAATAAYSITVTDTGDSGPATSTGTPTQTLSRAAAQQLLITWQADDPEGDRLVYSLYFRGEGELEWKLLKSGMHENSFTLDGDALADGRYYFRVVASDREVNPPGTARESDLISTPVLIDNTPPVLKAGTPSRNSGAVDLEFEATDATSPLRRCEYSIDAGPWVPMVSEDGVIDSLSEKFHLHLDGVAGGEHLLVLRAIDSGNNSGLAKIVLR